MRSPCRPSCNGTPIGPSSPSGRSGFPLSSGSPTMCSRWTRNSRWPPRRSQPRSTVRTPSASSTRSRTTSGSEIVRSLETDPAPMPDKKTKDSGSAPPIDLDLKARPTAGPANHDMNRFHIFLIDTGWSTAVSKLVRSHLPLLYEYQSQDSLYLLTPEQSVEILKLDPSSSVTIRPSSCTISTPARWPRASQLSRISPESRPIQEAGTGVVPAPGVRPFSHLAPVRRCSGYRGPARTESRGGQRHDQDPPRGIHRITLTTKLTSLS